MKRSQFAISALMACAWLWLAGVTLQAQVVPGADKVLFDRAIAALKNSEYVQARDLMESVINIYPDSQYVPQAKFSIADAWYQDGNYKRAEVEYRDFVIFFPNRPEVAERG